MYLIYDSYFDRLRKSYFKKVFQNYARPGSKVLDYGSGPGDALLVAKDLGLQAVGIDLFTRSIKLAQKRGLQVNLGDYHNLSKYYSPNSFDLIFIQSVVEHMSSPITELLEIKKYLKKGGHLVISSPTPSTYFWDDPTHVRPYTPKSFKILAEVLELKLVTVNYVFAYLLNITLTSRLFYLLINLLPLSLGSNLIGVYQKS